MPRSPARPSYIRTSIISTSARSATPPTGSSPASTTASRRLRRSGGFETNERLPLSDFPLPAYNLIRLNRYLIGSLQFSSGCPYRCEFCDIPALYGRQPRLKTPEQITAELDAMLAQSFRPPVVYFVDDNFIGNRKAAREMLPHLIAWQRKHGYPLQFACEATLNLAKQTEILALMREAQFLTVFVGIETPDADALKAMRKEHNASLPMLEAINTLNSYGLEVTSGIILGLDTDTADSESRLKDFIDISADSDPHHQSVAGAAADAVVGSPQARRAPDR